MSAGLHSMTYGELPDERSFRKAFQREVGDRDYRISGPPAEQAGLAGSYDEDELWELVSSLTEAFNENADWEPSRNGEGLDPEEAGDWASSILSTLGFEWI